MLRASSYNIYVDLPGNRENMLLVHGYTGAYDKVSRLVATYVRSLEAGRPTKPLYGDWSPEPPIDHQVACPDEQTIEALQQRGYLTEKGPEEEEAYFCQVATVLHDQSRRPGYLFMPTYDCNLRCPYCFQDHMRTNPAFQHLLRTMGHAVIDRIFAAIPQIEAHHNLPEDAQRRRSIGFFGGEPLLARSRPVVEYIIHKAQALGEASFYAITNGTDLHVYRDLLGPGVLSFLQITLDGPTAEHDKRRIYADGSGSFARIAQNITMALDLGVQISARMNIDRNNIGQLPELADEIVTRGWDQYPTFSAYTAVIHAANEKTDTRTTLSSWALDKELSKMRGEYPNIRVIERPDDSTKDKARQIFKSREIPQLQATFCSAHNGMYLFDAFGDIYACWERTGNPNIRIGRVTQAGDFVLEEKFNKMWRSRNVTTNPICRKCRYALYCGGGCAVLAEGQRGEFFTNYCDGYSARFRSSVAEAYLDHIADKADSAAMERGCHA